jgi:hypothetical protein
MLFSSNSSYNLDPLHYGYLVVHRSVETWVREVWSYTLLLVVDEHE